MSLFLPSMSLSRRKSCGFWKLGLSLLLITHDLRIAAQVCDRIAVMKNGAVIEEGAAAAVFESPRHE